MAAACVAPFASPRLRLRRRRASGCPPDRTSSSGALLALERSSRTLRCVLRTRGGLSDLAKASANSQPAVGPSRTSFSSASTIASELSSGFVAFSPRLCQVFSRQTAASPRARPEAAKGQPSLAAPAVARTLLDRGRQRTAEPAEAVDCEPRTDRFQPGSSCRRSWYSAYTARRLRAERARVRKHASHRPTAEADVAARRAVRRRVGLARIRLSQNRVRRDLENEVAAGRPPPA